jgi:sugar lactone lactonase YvrE
MVKTVCAVCICLSAWAQQPNTLFKAYDFTAENVFSENIEGPCFDAAGNLYVVNFQRDGTIGRVDDNGNATLFVNLPYKSIANAIVFTSKGDMLLADWIGHNVLRVNMKTKGVSVLAHKGFNQPNDLVINQRDQVFASDPDWKKGTGRIWRVEPDGEAEVVWDNLGTTNGIELNPDETILYVNESVQRKVWAFPVDKKGNLSTPRLFHEFADFGLDGMKCDARGNLYVTRYDKGTVAVLSPNGKLVREIALKGKKPSNLVFGGTDGKTVFVTLQDRKGMEFFRAEIPGRKFKK